MNTGADRVKGHSRLRFPYGNCRTPCTTWVLPQPCHEGVLHQRDQRTLGIGTVPGVRRDDRRVRADLQRLAHLFGRVRLVPVEAVEPAEAPAMSQSLFGADGTPALPNSDPFDPLPSAPATPA